jgi:hypothetical protein
VLIFTLHAIRPDHPRTATLLKRFEEELDWQQPLEVGRNDLVEIAFVGGDAAEERRRALDALNAAGEDWPEFFGYATHP